MRMGVRQHQLSPADTCDQKVLCESRGNCDMTVNDDFVYCSVLEVELRTSCVLSTL